MTDRDAEHWDARYLNSTPPSTLAPPEIVSVHLADLAEGSRVLDVACGWGDAGLWLAARGADVTLADISEVALAAARSRADAIDLPISTAETNLETEPVLPGPWDAIICTHYLDRALLERLAAELAPGGRLVAAIATTKNLERHERPSARFLLEPGELANHVPSLEVLHHDESWRANGVCEAWLVAERPNPAD